MFGKRFFSKMLIPNSFFYCSDTMGSSHKRTNVRSEVGSAISG